jgi:hypothetical protein
MHFHFITTVSARMASIVSQIVNAATQVALGLLK